MKAVENAVHIIDVTFHRWFNADGTLGVGDGTDKIAGTRKEEVEKVLKDLMKRLDGLKDGVVEETKVIKEETKQKKTRIYS